MKNERRDIQLAGATLSGDSYDTNGSIKAKKQVTLNPYNTTRRDN